MLWKIVVIHAAKSKCGVWYFRLCSIIVLYVHSLCRPRLHQPTHSICIHSFVNQSASDIVWINTVFNILGFLSLLCPRKIRKSGILHSLTGCHRRGFRWARDLKKKQQTGGICKWGSTCASNGSPRSSTRTGNEWTHIGDKVANFSEKFECLLLLWLHLMEKWGGQECLHV